MQIQEYYYQTNSSLGITERNQIAVLFDFNENAPSEIKLEGRGTYKRIMAGVISDEFVSKGFSNCQIYQYQDFIIYGVDKIYDSWVTLFVPESEILKKCKDIWNNPDKYSRYEKNTDDAYYKFLKFLWVCRPYQEDIRLSDLV